MKVTPGLLVGPRQANLEIGHGIYERNGFLYSSMRGTLHHGRNSVSVLSSSASLVTPKIGSVVIGKITKINPRFATVLILAVGNEKVSDRGDGYVGIIQQKDVRQTNIDAVKIFECFRPADIVKARVVSLGEQKNFILSTASNELGVVMAQSLAGHTMIPISWLEMVCPKTGIKEFRKCAKPEEKTEADQEMAP